MNFVNHALTDTEKLAELSLRAARSNPMHNKTKHSEIAASLALFAMAARIDSAQTTKSLESHFLQNQGKAHCIFEKARTMEAKQ